MEILNSVKILAERLETHPEEFKYDKKFDSQCRAILELARGSEESLWFLNEQEKDILIRAMRKIKRKEFEDDVLLQLLEDKEEHTGPASVKFKTQGRYGQAQIQAEGQPVNYGWTDPRIHLNSMQIEHCAKYGIDPKSYAKLMATTTTK